MGLPRRPTSFPRNLGSTLGATLLGGVLNVSLVGRADLDQVRDLLDRPASLAGGAAVRLALGDALHMTFWAVFAAAVGTLLVALLVPRVVLATRAPAPALGLE